MPKSRPTQVIIHRLELQETERRILEQAVTAYSIRNVTRGFYNLTSDMTTLVVILILLEQLTGRKFIGGAILELLKGGASSLAAGIADAWVDYRDAAAEDYTEYGEAALDFWSNLFDSFGDFRGWLRGNR